MTRTSLFFGIALSLAACTTPSKAPANLDLSSIQKLDIGTTNQRTVALLLGSPSEVIHLKGQLAGQDDWIYRESNEQVSTPRITLRFDTQTDVLLWATLIPKPGDPFASKNQALKYFGDASFSCKDQGWQSNHYYSYDSVCQDKKNGVTLFVNDGNENVNSLIFDSPVKRDLAATSSK